MCFSLLEALQSQFLVVLLKTSQFLNHSLLLSVRMRLVLVKKVLYRKSEVIFWNPQFYVTIDSISILTVAIDVVLINFHLGYVVGCAPLLSGLVIFQEDQPRAKLVQFCLNLHIKIMYNFHYLKKSLLALSFLALRTLSSHTWAYFATMEFL